MPSKVLKLLEFVGFSGDRAQGFAELEQSTQLVDGLRCPLAILIMLCYQCYIEHIFGESNLRMAPFNYTSQTHLKSDLARSMKSTRTVPCKKACQ